MTTWPEWPTLTIEGLMGSASALFKTLIFSNRAFFEESLFFYGPASRVLFWRPSERPDRPTSGPINECPHKQLIMILLLFLFWQKKKNFRNWTIGDVSSRRKGRYVPLPRCGVWPWHRPSTSWAADRLFGAGVGAQLCLLLLFFSPTCILASSRLYSSFRLNLSITPSHPLPPLVSIFSLCFSSLFCCSRIYICLFSHSFLPSLWANFVRVDLIGEKNVDLSRCFFLFF